MSCCFAIFIFIYLSFYFNLISFPSFVVHLYVCRLLWIKRFVQLWESSLITKKKKSSSLFKFKIGSKSILEKQHSYFVKHVLFLKVLIKKFKIRKIKVKLVLEQIKFFKNFKKYKCFMI